MASLSFRSETNGGDSTITVNNVDAGLPTGTASGDIQSIWVGCAVLAAGTPPAITTPAGWTKQGSSRVLPLAGAVLNAQITLFTKVAGGSEGTVNLATNGGTNAAISFIRKSYQNPSATTPFAQVSFIPAAAVAGTSVSVSGINTGAENALIDVYIAQGAAQNAAPPASMTERADNSSQGISSADEIISAPSGTGSRNFTLPASADYLWGIAEFRSDSAPTPETWRDAPLSMRQPPQKEFRRAFDIADYFPRSNIEAWFLREWWPAASASGVTGTAAVTLGSDTSSATGTTTVVGTSARTLAGDASSASGTTTILGTASPTLGNDTSSASGAVGSPVTGTVAATLANDTASATGTTTVVGTSARTLAGDASSATGTTTVVGTSARTLGADTSSAAGTTTVVGSAAVTLGSDTSTASGSVGGAVSGSGSPTTGSDTSSASGTTTVVGSAAVTLGSDTAAASGATPGPQVDEFAGFWAAAPRIRKRLDEEADAAIEAAEIIQRVATKAKDRQRAEQLEAAILAANTRAQYEALEARVRWAKKRAQELRRKDDDDIAAVLLLIE